jgi:mRNA-degrading endonuclease RelE of RelBE toxin-antitoxin system
LQVLLTKTAQKDLARIPKDRRSQVLQALQALESWPLLEGMDISFALEKVNQEPG